jgi:fused signal recognition particle receptor
MLGWFKKKFKKQERIVPAADAGIDSLSTDTPFSEPEQPENDTAAVADAPFGAAQDQDEEEPVAALTETDRSDLCKAEEQVTEPGPGTTGRPSSQPASASEPESPQELHIEPPAADKPLKIKKESEVQKQPGKKQKSLFSRLTERLGKTRETFTYQLDALFLGKKEIDAEMLDDLEEILITADLGVATTQELLEVARRKVKRKELYDPKSLKETLKAQIKKLITENDEDASLVMPDKGPFVIMVIGVNGVGKTTTIGKIARKFQQAGNSVLLVAGDTFRAAAVAQLKIWAERSNIPVVAHKEGADPSSVVFDALGIAQAENIDVVIVDTAGRMHTKDNLMEELKKIKRVMGKKLKGAPHEVMLVIDATTGQNGVSQARLFDDAVGVSGITLTKLDGTSKGGIVANICKEMKIPIRFIGIGEKMSDLQDFDATQFVDALFHDRTTSETEQ